MELLLFSSPEIFVSFQTLLGVIVFVIFVIFLVGMWRECKLAKLLKKSPSVEHTENDKNAEFVFSSDHLTPMERREELLNNIEDGRFYVVSSLRNSDTTIVCAKRYDAEEQRLYCYAYLWISGRGVYNLHVIDPRGIFKFRDFLGHKLLRIDFDRNPHLIVFEEENISPYLTERDYNDIVQSLQKAGTDWKIEKSEENILGSYKYLLKVNKNKIINTTNK